MCWTKVNLSIWKRAVGRVQINITTGRQQGTVENMNILYWKVNFILRVSYVVGERNNMVWREK